MRRNSDQADTWFWTRCEPEPNSNCLLWCQGGVRGYGRVRVGGIKILAHRLAYELVHGPIPRGMCVLHRCDVPLCCNPSHLFLGTNADNAADRDQKQRQARYERNSSAKLTRAAIHKIRAALDRGATTRARGRKYGVSGSTISHAANGRNWKGVGVPRPLQPLSTPKLTAESVRDIRARHAAGETGRALGKHYGVSEAQISRIVNGRRWRAVPR